MSDPPQSQGGRAPRVSDADLLAVFDDTDDPVLSTGEVADCIPIQRRGTLDRLRDLEEQGYIASKSIGGRNTVWWPVDDAPDPDADRPGNTRDPPPPADAGEPEPDPADVDVDAEPVEPDLQDAIDDVDLPGSGDTLAARRDALRRLYDHLREHGTAKKRDFLEQIDADAVGYASPESFWSNCVKGRDSLQALPAVDPPGEGEHTWRYRGD